MAGSEELFSNKKSKKFLGQAKKGSKKSKKATAAESGGSGAPAKGRRKSSVAKSIESLVQPKAKEFHPDEEGDFSGIMFGILELH